MLTRLIFSIGWRWPLENSSFHCSWLIISILIESLKPQILIIKPQFFSKNWGFLLVEVDQTEVFNAVDAGRHSNSNVDHWRCWRHGRPFLLMFSSHPIKLKTWKFYKSLWEESNSGTVQSQMAELVERAFNVSILSSIPSSNPA